MSTDKNPQATALDSTSKPLTAKIRKSTKKVEEKQAPQPQFNVDNSTKGFVYMDNVGKILDVALSTEENVILYGKGGYGKSEYTIEFLKEHGIEAPYVMTMGNGMTTDRLFGGLDLPKFDSTGKLEYLVENSFMNSEIVVFEELFDSPDFILEQLKDILSSGYFRNGTQVFKIKTRTIICCTNKTREEFAKNNSLKALMERFPLELEVKWDNHNRITYENLLNTKLGFADPMLTYICEQFHINGATISPRIAIKAAKIIAQMGPDTLHYIADFSIKPELLKNSIAKFKSVFEINDLVSQLKIEKVKFDDLGDLDTEDKITLAGKINRTMYAHITKLKSIKADDSLITTTQAAVKEFTGYYEANKKTLDLLQSIAGI